MKKVLFVFGTRPEAIKMAPIIAKMSNYSDRLSHKICVTGQHREMLDQILSIFNIVPDIDLDLMEKNQTLASLTSKAVGVMDGVLKKEKPDIVLVQGDTTTAMVGALAAFYQKIPVGHVEAGLRTNDFYNPFPEEINRRLISVLTTYHFAPTQRAYDTLISEGYSKDKVFMTGNTVVDALLTASTKINGNDYDKNENNKLILVTAHRRENFDKPISNICGALKEITTRNDNVQIIYPVHLNPNISSPVHQLLKDQERIELIPPVDYLSLIRMIKRSYLILTDSGGIQEEAPTFGKPVLVMRETTERPEGIDAGVAKLVGTDKENIIYNVEKLLNDEKEYRKMSQSVSPYGDGKSSERIIDIILNVK